MLLNCKFVRKLLHFLNKSFIIDLATESELYKYSVTKNESEIH